MRVILPLELDQTVLDTSQTRDTKEMGSRFDGTHGGRIFLVARATTGARCTRGGREGEDARHVYGFTCGHKVFAFSRRYSIFTLNGFIIIYILYIYYYILYIFLYYYYILDIICYIVITWIDI